jgi:hypothetical protein
VEQQFGLIPEVHETEQAYSLQSDRSERTVLSAAQLQVNVTNLCRCRRTGAGSCTQSQSTVRCALPQRRAHAPEQLSFVDPKQVS